MPVNHSLNRHDADDGNPYAPPPPEPVVGPEEYDEKLLEKYRGLLILWGNLLFLVVTVMFLWILLAAFSSLGYHFEPSFERPMLSWRRVVWYGLVTMFSVLYLLDLATIRAACRALGYSSLWTSAHLLTALFFPIGTMFIHAMLQIKLIHYVSFAELKREMKYTATLK